MIRRLMIVACLAVAAVLPSACEAPVNLKTALSVTDVISGWYDFGVVSGENKIVPSITFRLKNNDTRPLAGVQLTVAFWLAGKDGEQDSKMLQAIGGSSPLAPGASTEPITVRADVGFTSFAPRSEMLGLSTFLDATAKLFAKRGGKIVPIGEFKVERQLIPHATNPTGRE